MHPTLFTLGYEGLTIDHSKMPTYFCTVGTVNRSVVMNATEKALVRLGAACAQALSELPMVLGLLHI